MKGAPTIDYKNIKLLKKYVSENGKFYLQELQMLVKKNNESCHYQLNGQEI